MADRQERVAACDQRCDCTMRSGSTRSRPPICLDCGRRIALSTDESPAATRLPSEVEAFASVAQAIRDSYEPLGARVHVNSMFRSITITVPATGRSGVEYDWHIKWRRSPK